MGIRLAPLLLVAMERLLSHIKGIMVVLASELALGTQVVEEVALIQQQEPEVLEILQRAELAVTDN